jgi:hypothetical protein
MSGGTLALVVILGAIVAAVVALIRDEARGGNTMPTPVRPNAARHSVRLFDPALVILSHEPPDHEYSPGEAHMQTQLHRKCHPDECPRKAAALDKLVECGHIHLDTARWM